MVLARAAPLRIRQCAPYVRSCGRGFEVRIVARVCKRGQNGCWVDWRSLSHYTQHFAVRARSVVTKPCPGTFDKALEGAVKMLDMDEHKSTASTKRTLRMVSDVLAMKLMRCYGVLDVDIDDFLSHCKTDDAMDVDAAVSDGLRTPVVPRAVTTQKRRRKKTPTPKSKTLEASPYHPAHQRRRRRSPPKADGAAVVSAGVDTDPRLPQTTRRRGEAPTSPAPRLRLDDPLEVTGIEFGGHLKASTAVDRHRLSSELKTRPDLAEWYVRAAMTLAAPSTVARFVAIGATRLSRLVPDRLLARPPPDLRDRQRRERRAAVRAAALNSGTWYRAVWGLGEPAPRTARVPVLKPGESLALVRHDDERTVDALAAFLTGHSYWSTLGVVCEETQRGALFVEGLARRRLARVRDALLEPFDLLRRISGMSDVLYDAIVPFLDEALVALAGAKNGTRVGRRAFGEDRGRREGRGASRCCLGVDAGPRIACCARRDRRPPRRLRGTRELFRFPPAAPRRQVAFAAPAVVLARASQ